MRTSLVLAIVATSLAASSALPTPAAATDKDQALKACAGNRNCSIMESKQGDKGVDLQIVQSDGTINEVTCPSKGPCAVVYRPKNGAGKPVVIKGANPVSVIGGTPPKTGTADGKARPVKTVKRDHRGDTTKYVKPGKFAGTRDGHDPGWGNYEPKKGTGDTIVRDHRH